ncbi:hypothetical protein F5B21DRAFT_500672 [Xylaria acuta]|nr:hypothetical protein F5B21DRAFT_500672 [Xylaria acuta]
MVVPSSARTNFIIIPLPFPILFAVSRGIPEGDNLLRGPHATGSRTQRSSSRNSSSTPPFGHARRRPHTPRRRNQRSIHHRLDIEQAKKRSRANEFAVPLIEDQRAAAVETRTHRAAAIASATFLRIDSLVSLSTRGSSTTPTPTSRPNQTSSSRLPRDKLHKQPRRTDLVVVVVVVVDAAAVGIDEPRGRGPASPSAACAAGVSRRGESPDTARPKTAGILTTHSTATRFSAGLAGKPNHVKDVAAAAAADEERLPDPRRRRRRPTLTTATATATKAFLEEISAPGEPAQPYPHGARTAAEAVALQPGRARPSNSGLGEDEDDEDDEDNDDDDGAAAAALDRKNSLDLASLVVVPVSSACHGKQQGDARQK